MKTRTVKFSYGTINDASLEIPAEAFSPIDAAKLIRKSYFEYAFRPGCGLMSDECLTSSIGQANFFAGALGGYESRVRPEMFEAIRGILASVPGQALAVAAYREPKATLKEHYARASQNEVLSKDQREFFARMAKVTV